MVQATAAAVTAAEATVVVTAAVVEQLLAGQGRWEEGAATVVRATAAGAIAAGPSAAWVTAVMLARRPVAQGCKGLGAVTATAAGATAATKEEVDWSTPAVQGTRAQWAAKAVALTAARKAAASQAGREGALGGHWLVARRADRQKDLRCTVEPQQNDCHDRLDTERSLAGKGTSAGCRLRAAVSVKG